MLLQPTAVRFRQAVFERRLGEDALGKCKGILRVPFSTQAEGLEALEEEERAEGVQSRAEVAQNLYAALDGERDRPEGLAEFKAVVALRRLGECWEFARAHPIKLACGGD